MGRLNGVEQRVSLITLGVADVDAARAFYERLGWRCDLPLYDIAFFQAGGLVFSTASRLTGSRWAAAIVFAIAS